MTRTIFVQLQSDGTVEVYDEDIEFVKRFKDAEEYRKWLMTDCQDCTRRRLS